MAERQTADTLEQIRADHVARYMWVRGAVAGKDVVDIGCGVGYGASIMSESAKSIHAFDRDMDAIEYAMLKWSRPGIKFSMMEATGLWDCGRYDVAVAFEIVEHLQHPELMLRRARACCRSLFISAPNEEGMPFDKKRFPFHERHYRSDEMVALLESCGWIVQGFFHQKGRESSVEYGHDAGARTLVYAAS